MSESKPGLDFHPLTSDRWDDFETLFGPRGAVTGCWCMWWRVKRKDWEAKSKPRPPVKVRRPNCFDLILM